MEMDHIKPIQRLLEDTAKHGGLIVLSKEYR